MQRRIESHPILDFPEKKKVKFTFDGKELWGYEDEPIAAALVAAGYTKMRESLKGHPRGLFCAIGKCSSCFMIVNGIPNVRTCVEPLKEGMKVEIQYGRGEIGKNLD
jgi:aerobic-type carbon monoxide dehydrogenase small subunit (CoxS/CutS family)